MQKYIKNFTNGNQVNVILPDEEIDTIQLQRFLYSVVAQENVSINIKGKIDDKIQKMFNIYLTFNKDVKGLNIYHSAKIILNDNQIYYKLFTSPETKIQCSKLDQVDQRFWPYVPNDDSFIQNLKPCDQFIVTDNSKDENIGFIPQCMYQT